MLTLLLTLAWLTQAAQGPQPGTVTVRVVDAMTKAPLGGARTTLVCFGGGGATARQFYGQGFQTEVLVGAQNFYGPLILNAVVGADGTLTRSVPAGECGIEAVGLPGYADRSAMRRYEVSAGEQVTIIREMVRRAAIAGTVVDGSRTPIAGVTMVIESQSVIAGARQWTAVQWIDTDAQGRFTFSLFPGVTEYRLAAPQLKFAAAPKPFTIAPGETRTLELAAVRRPLFSIAGRLERPGVNLGFVTATLERADSPPAIPFVAAETRANDKGAFAFAGVPEGRYRVRVNTAAVTTGYAPSDVLAGIVEIDVARNLSDVVVPLAPGNQINGRVRFEGESPSPASFVGVGFSFPPADGGPLAAARATGTVGTVFWTRALPPGRYLLQPMMAPPGDWRLKSAIVDGVDVTDVPFDNSRTGVVGIVVTYTDRWTDMRGRIRDADEREAPEATVVIFSTDPATWTNPTGRRMRIRQATQRGHFWFADLPPGEYFAAAVPTADVHCSERAADVAWLKTIAPRAQRVTLREMESLELTLVVSRARESLGPKASPRGAGESSR